MRNLDYHIFKDNLFEQFAKIGKAVASPKRLELLEVLCQGERTVEALAEETELSVANASKHLQALKAANMVATERRGNFVSYRLADEGVREFCGALRRLAEARLGDVVKIREDFFRLHADVEAMDAEALLARMKKRNAVLVDVRPAEEFLAERIAGAVSIPLRDLEARLAELPVGKEIVVYCRGTSCVLSFQAVEILKAAGRRAAVLKCGVHEWRERGYPVSAGAAG